MVEYIRITIPCVKGEPMRIDKLISDMGLASRKECALAAKLYDFCGASYFNVL